MNSLSQCSVLQLVVLCSNTSIQNYIPWLASCIRLYTDIPVTVFQLLSDSPILRRWRDLIT